MDRLPEVRFSGCKLRLVFRCPLDAGVKVNQFADQAAYFFVEIGEKLISLLIERAEVVLVIFKERRAVVSRFDSVPVQMPPIAVVGNTRSEERRVGKECRS